MSKKIYVCVSGCTDGFCFLIIPEGDAQPRYCPFSRSEEETWCEIEDTEIAKEAAGLLKSVIREKIEALSYKAAFLTELQGRVDEIMEEILSG